MQTERCGFPPAGMHSAKATAQSFSMTRIPDGQMSALKDDFQYNLKLLEGRDSELEKFEALLQTMTAQAEDKDALLARLRSDAAEMESGAPCLLEAGRNAGGEQCILWLHARRG